MFSRGNDLFVQPDEMKTLQQGFHLLCVKLRICLVKYQHESIVGDSFKLRNGLLAWKQASHRE